MTAKRENRTTIVIEPATRDVLKHLARKDQSYNSLLIDLVKVYEEHNVNLGFVARSASTTK